MEGTAVKAEEVRAASARLPERQREALELRDRDGRSYAEIAASLEIGPGAVAQLIAHARINLYDELRGTALASVAPSPECERALPLIAMREDGQLDPASEDARWLDPHLAGCDRCTLAVEQMGEAEAAYRAQEPTDPGPEADRPTAVAAASPSARRRRRAILAAALAGLLLLGAVAAVLAATNRSAVPVEPASVRASKQGAGLGKSDAAPAHGKARNDAGASHKAKRSSDGGKAGGPQATATETASAPVAAPVGSDGGDESGNPGSGGGHPSGKAAVEPTHQTAASKPSAKPKPAAPSSPPPSSTASAPAPAPESTIPAEEPADKPGRSDEAPGKAVGRPPR